jgi:hypothetical protein
MNQLSVNRIGRRAIALSVSRPAASNVRRFATARGNLRAAPIGTLVCHWRRDSATRALLAVWTVSQSGREPAAPVPLRRAS